MKRIISILWWVLFVMTTLYPAGVIISACFGCTFRLISVMAFAIANALLSVCIVVLGHVGKSTIENKVIQFLLAIITPLSIINAMFCICTSPQFWTIASSVLSVGCCCYLSRKYGEPMALKNIALVLSLLMVWPAVFLSIIISTLGNLSQNTVVQTVESPGGEYYAKVIDSDQGALGGSTFVDVYKNNGINAILFKIESNPQRVYIGDWGEYKKMRVYWKDDGRLVINSVEYEIE